jgi:hypothetical protein
MQFINIFAVITILIFAVIWIARFNPASKFLYLFFAFIPAFSSNFEVDFFRQIFQGASILILISNVRHFMSYGFRINSIFKVAFVILLLVAISYLGNNINNQLYFPAVFNIVTSLSSMFYAFRKLETPKKMEGLFSFTAYLALILSVYSIIEGLLFTHDRSEVTFSNTNYLAFYLGIGFILFMKKDREKMKYIFMAIIALGIYATESRIVILGLCFLFFIHSLQLLARKSFYKILPIYIAAILVVLYCFSSASNNRFNTKAADSSDGERYAIMAISMEIVKKEPINGIGYGQFIEKFSNYKPYGNAFVSQLYRRKEIVTHSDYLRVIDELGVPAFILFIIYIIYIGKKCYKEKLIWSFFMYVLIFSTAHNNMNSLLFWFFLLLPLHYLSVKNQVRKIS